MSDASTAPGLFMKLFSMEIVLAGNILTDRMGFQNSEAPACLRLCGFATSR